jgi:hypothetical protein
MEYLDHIVPTLEIFIDDSISFTPETTMGLVTDNGLQETDNNGDSWDGICNAATIKYSGL